VTLATLRHARYVVTENPITLVAFSMLFVLFVLATLGPSLAPFDPLKSDTGNTLRPPSVRHWFGTDQLGRDMLSRVMVAARLDMAMAFSAVALSFLAGSLAGACAGVFGGWTERVVSRISDTIMAFPLFVLAMGIVAALGNSVFNVILATAIINLPFYVRMARAEANVRREAGFVEAARLSGNSTMRVLTVHIYPNCLPPMMVQASLNLGWAMLNAAGLAFIGLGVRPPTPEWGILVAEGASFIISGEWWIAVFPGLALMSAVFCFNLMGDGLRDIMDPRKRT
jgi:peptide/nickel transport system permease protein